MLLEHEYANFSVMKIVELGSLETRMLLARGLMPFFCEAACHKKSSLSVQRLVELEPAGMEPLILQYFGEHLRLKEVLASESGVHVIIKMLRHGSNEFLGFVFERTCKSLAKLAD
jgi:hypothetical protein